MKNIKEFVEVVMSYLARIAIIAVVIAVIVAVIFTFTNSATAQRWFKSMFSEFNGLERTITVYDYNGKVLREWSGKFAVSDSENEVYFDNEQGRRVIIHGGIVIDEEEPTFKIIED